MELWTELREEPVRVAADDATLESELLMEEMRLEAELVTDEAWLLRLEVTEAATDERLEESEEALLADDVNVERSVVATVWAETAAARATMVRSLNCMFAAVWKN
jgi:hypothetical protein